MKTPQSKSRVEGRAPNNPRSARPFPWAKEEDALLRKLTDREVAEKLNRTLGALRDRCKFLGKPAVGHAPQPFRMERQLPDKEVARPMGDSLTSVRHARTNRNILGVRRAAPEWREEEEALAGHSARSEIAGRLKRPLATVRLRRSQKGLPPPEPRRLTLLKTLEE